MRSNRIYETVFDATWVRSILGDAEPERPDDEKPTYDVFVSYSWEDRDWVVGYLAPRLQDAGLRIAIDLDLLPGSNWAEELRRMRESSEFFLPVLSPAWATSRGAQEEFELMSNRVGKIVPVLLRPTHLPPFLAGLYYADFTEPLRMESAMELLIHALGGRKEQTAEASQPGLTGRAGSQPKPRIAAASDLDTVLPPRKPGRASVGPISAAT